MNKLTVSNCNKPGVGVILVLFILLVIVVVTFRPPAGISPGYPGGEGGVSATGSRGFVVNNNSSYTLVLISVRGSSHPPSPRDIGPGESSGYELTTYGPFSSYAIVTYNVADSSGTNVGTLSFRMVNFALFNGYEIRSIETSGPIIAIASDNNLNVSDAVPTLF
ncbi:hypothetical protein SAMN05444162_0751 [Paenibacillaceae bacterium GAS479]|nr:hypothetical protein SAMN05444162_0751 [Paenibacillaceae bacterium GAS479]